MDAIARLEAHFAVTIPLGYRTWAQRNYIDYRNHRDSYLWVCEAEWIPPDKIPTYDLWRSDVIPGLIPFAFTGAQDNWCWNSQVVTGDAEYEVLFCYHDEMLADAYAPTFPGWFYRNCLEYASSAVDDDPERIVEARRNLRLWSQRLAEIHSGTWAGHLLALSEASPSRYHHPKLREDLTVFGFITAMEADDIVGREFGQRYLGEKVAWGTFPDP